MEESSTEALVKKAATHGGGGDSGGDEECGDEYDCGLGGGGTLVVSAATVEAATEATPGQRQRLGRLSRRRIVGRERTTA